MAYEKFLDNMWRNLYSQRPLTRSSGVADLQRATWARAGQEPMSESSRRGQRLPEEWEDKPVSDEKALRLLVDGASDGLALLSAGGRIVQVNEVVARFLGTSCEHLLGRLVTDPVIGLQIEPDFLSRALSTRAGVSRAQALGDGRKALVTIRPVDASDDGMQHLLLAIRDVTGVEQLVSRIQATAPARPGRWWEMRRGEAEATRLIMESRAMQAVAKTAVEFARVDSPVLITGETGTGKSLLARVIHQSSARSHGPLRELNCGAIPGELMESELFGYAAGAFTSADARGKTGLIEFSDTGTLLLDEIGDLAPPLQVKLLQFLEAGEVWPVGARKPKRVDVRIIAATNADLPTLIQQRLFRRDLFYRLNVLVLHVPPLRDHAEDIPSLVDMMVTLLESRVGRRLTLSKGALDVLARYSFPGNVRELWNLMERLAVSCRTGLVDVSDLPIDVTKSALSAGLPVNGATLREVLRNVEARIVREALARCGSQTKAAKQLGIAQATVARKARMLTAPRDPGLADVTPPPLGSRQASALG
jgi:PAS domain S-box-containing protein